MTEILLTLGEFSICATLFFSVPFGFWLHDKSKQNKEKIEKKTVHPVKPFVVSEYYERMEKVSLEIQEEQEKKEKYNITLWWGLDGLRLYDDGTTKWISRRKQEPVNQNISYTPCQSQVASSLFALDYMNLSQQIEQNSINMRDTIIEAQTQSDLSELRNMLFQQKIVTEFRPYITPALYHTPPYYQSMCNSYFN